MTNLEPQVNKVKAVIGILGLVALMSYLAHLWPTIAIAALLTLLLGLLYEVSLSLKYVEAFLPNIAADCALMRGHVTKIRTPDELRDHDERGMGQGET